MTKYFLFLSFFCFSQNQGIKNKTDLISYYKDGQVMSIKYKNDYLSTNGKPVYVFFDSLCDKTQKKREYKHSILDDGYNITRNYYKDSLITVRRDYRIYTNSEKGLLDSLILGKDDNYYSIILNSKSKPIKVYFKYNKDSLVNRLVVSKTDSISYKTNRTYLAQDYKKATSFDGDFIYQSENNFSLQISFIDKFNMKYILYIENEAFSIYVKFFKNNIPNIYGHYNSLGKSGIWYTYYDNGRLSSEGEYCGSEFDSNGNEINIKKTGKWLYYTGQGCIDKEENWEKGVLINTIHQKK